MTHANEPAAAPGTPGSATGRATLAHRIYESLMDLGEQSLDAENQSTAYSGLWDALQQSVDASAALASAIAALEKAESLRGLDV